jgi:hypothetical protein
VLVHDELTQASFPDTDVIHALLFFHKHSICTFEDWKAISLHEFDEMLLFPTDESEDNPTTISGLKMSIVKVLKKLHYQLLVPSREL